jgi:hypothetical protein
MNGLALMSGDPALVAWVAATVIDDVVHSVR